MGGMVPGRVDWVSQQSPDSHDWLEYMLTYGDTPLAASTGIPAGMSQHELGVLDHLSIGEDSVDAAYKTLQDGNSWRACKTTAIRRWARTAKGSSTSMTRTESGWS